MRIGDVAALTGLSARVIRSYEARGWTRPVHAGAGHRRYDDADVARLHTIRALLAADIPPDLALRAADGNVDVGERERVGRALTLLAEQVQTAAATVLADPRDGDDDQPEHHISLMFDTFLVRTRMESVLTTALRPAGVPSEYAIISLIAVEGAMTPATVARLVGTAPSTLGGRISGLVRRGLLRRVPDGDDRRMWRLELTAEGRRLYDDAIPHARICHFRIEDALKARGIHSGAIRAALLTLSATLGSLLPDRAGPS